MSYTPDCSDPRVQAQIKDGSLPSNLCDYPYDVLQVVCQRQPSLCTPYPGAQQPSIWEPIWGTVEDFGGRILTTGESVGTGVLGTVDLANTLVKFLPLILVGAGVWFLMNQRR